MRLAFPKRIHRWFKTIFLAFNVSLVEVKFALYVAKEVNADKW
jgi:hypothetical protein